MKTEWKMENGEWDEKQTSIVFQVTGTSGLCEAGRVTLYLDQSRPGRIKGATNVVAAPKKRTAKKREKHAERNAKESSLTLHLLSLSDLGRETRLDGRDGPSGTARVACDKVQTVLALVELGVGRFACFADNVFENVFPQNVLNVLLLETTTDNQPPAAVDGTRGTQLSKQVQGDVVLGTLHALGNLGNVGKDGLLVAFAHALRRQIGRAHV